MEGNRGSVLDLFPKPVKRGKVRIGHVEVSKLESMRSSRNGAIFFCPPGTYTTLHVNGELMMSDTPMETRTNKRFIDRARGRVLIFGLGLGVVLRPLLAKPEVTHVIVVENNADVVALVEPKFSDPRLVVMDGDAKDPGLVDLFVDRGHSTFDTVWIDIWPEIGHQNEPEMKKLSSMWASVLHPGGGYIGCWSRTESKALRI